MRKKEIKKVKIKKTTKKKIKNKKPLPKFQKIING